MRINIEINTDGNGIGEADKALLATLIGGVQPQQPAAQEGQVTEVAVTPAEEPKPKRTRKAAPKPEPEPEPEPAEEPEEDLLGDDEPEAAEGPTLDDAKALATKLVGQEKSDEVRKALAAVGVKRVGDLKDNPDGIADFVAALS